MEKVLRQCVQTARKLLATHPNRKCYPHFSFIIQSGKVVEFGLNTNAVPPVHYGYKKGKTHAEINAYRKARGILEDEEFDVVNIRLNKRGDLRLSAPCEQCYTILRQLGCRRFYFSTDAGFARLP